MMAWKLYVSKNCYWHFSYYFEVIRTADAAKKHHRFYYSPTKVKKERTLSIPWKEEFQSYYHQKLISKVAYTDKKLSTCFNVKDQSKFDHQHDVVYYVDCRNETCRENYIGEIGHNWS